MVLTVNPLPTPDLGVDQVICEGGSITLDAGSYAAYAWSTGETTPTIPVSSADTYSVTVTDTNGCQGSDEMVLTVNALPVSTLNPAYTIVPGETLVLDAGAGFATYNWNTGSTDQTIETTVPGTFSVEISDLNSCTNIASTVVEYDLDTVHNVTINQGWGYFSTFVNPYNASMPDVFSPVVSNIILVKDTYGDSYWPYFNLNLIGDYTVGEGYQVNCTDTVICPIPGEIVIPESTPINVAAGWSFIGYLRMTPGDAVDMVSTIYSNILILKDQDGNSVWPYFNLNLIGNLIPGDGYQVLLDVTNTLTYPANGPSSKSEINKPDMQYFSKPGNTGSNMTLGIPLTAWDERPQYGDEIAVLSASGEIIGASVFTNDHMAISIWGDDLYSDQLENISEGERFTLIHWNQSSNQEIILRVQQWIEGDNYFNENQISIVGNISQKANETDIMISSSYFPNPFTDVATIEFIIPEAGKVDITLIDNTGRTIDIICSKDYPEGKQSIQYQNKNLAPGIYYYKLSYNNQFIINKLVKE